MKYKGNIKSRLDERSRQRSRPALHKRNGWHSAIGWF
jgi:hypothetical protein